MDKDTLLKLYGAAIFELKVIQARVAEYEKLLVELRNQENAKEKETPEEKNSSF